MAFRISGLAAHEHSQERRTCASELWALGSFWRELSIQGRMFITSCWHSGIVLKVVLSKECRMRKESGTQAGGVSAWTIAALPRLQTRRAT